MTYTRALAFTLGLTVAASAGLVGCNTGTHKKSSSTGSSTPTTPPPPPPPPAAMTSATLTAGTVALLQAQTGQVFSDTSGIVAMVFSLQAGVGNVTVRSLAFKASGTIDEKILGKADLIEDVNKNNVIDTGETPLATIASAAFTADDGTITFTLGTPLVLAPGTVRHFIVRLDGTAVVAATSLVGKTVILGFASAASIAAVDTAATPATVAPVISGATAYPLNGPAVTMGLTGHLLISEIYNTTNAEFIEIYNPSGYTYSLDNFYLTDCASDAGASPQFQYWEITTGNDAGAAPAFAPVIGVAAPTNTTDFLVRFPAGDTIAPGGVKVIAVDLGNYKAQHTFEPNYFLRPGTGTSATAKQMLTWNGPSGSTTTPPTFSANPVGSQAGLTDAQEHLLLFFWDGAPTAGGSAAASDVILDVDYVYWGAPNAANPRMKKLTSIAIDGIDTGTATTAYKDDNQGNIGTNVNPVPGSTSLMSMQRTNFVETGEVKTNGNGFFGHDEMSEDLDNNFTNSAGTTGRTPGTVP